MALKRIIPEISGALTIQTKALIKKNFLVLRRKWISTLLGAYIFPVLVLALLLNLQRFGEIKQGFGVGSPAPLGKPHLPAEKDFVVVAESNLGLDVHQAVQRFIEPLGGTSERLLVLDSESEANEHCATNRKGYSPCHACVVFEDSPETKGGTGNWKYTMRSDGTNVWSEKVNVFAHDSMTEAFWLPLQLAIDNAITDIALPSLSVYAYTTTKQGTVDRSRQADFSSTFMSLFVMIYFIGFLPIIYHAATFVTTERELGMAQLIDAMGGKPIARVMGVLIPLNTIYLPTWIVFGALYWHLLFDSSNAAIPIFWCIFTGVAITNATIFGAAFFKVRSISAIFVTACFLALAAIAGNSLESDAIPLSQVIACSLLFPSMNYAYAVSRMARFTYVDLPIDMASTAYLDKTKGLKEAYSTATWVFWLFLILQIIAYPILAVAAEHFMHGLSYTRRTFSSNADYQGSSVAVETSLLKKVYSPSILRRIICCCVGRNKAVTAVDDLNLVARKTQILCLLGVNGSGKTTTLDLIGGAQASSAGDVLINAPSTKLGICPQKNVLWPNLTVYEHVKHWSGIKGGRESPEALAQMIEACDLTTKMHSLAVTLSGGQKRKLQLACMFVGGSTVCLMDEVTTGLDPVSRRVIWNIILAERTKRSMIFTTHFLDEGEVLADHIVLLSQGQIKAQGSGAEMKNRFGGGYRVHVPKTMQVMDLGVRCTAHQDRIIYHTADSKSAAKLITKLEAAGCEDVAMQGPTIEDVFLKLTQDVDDAEQRDWGIMPTKTSSEAVDPRRHELHDGRQNTGMALAPGKATSTSRQLQILLKKRFTILPRFWIGPLIALVLPSIIPALVYPVSFPPTEGFERPVCGYITPSSGHSSRLALSFYYSYDMGHTSLTPYPVGPSSVNDTLAKVMLSYPIGSQFDPERYTYDEAFTLQPDLESFTDFISKNTLSNNGGIYVGDDTSPAVLAFNEQAGVYSASRMLNLFTSIRSQVKIDAGIGEFSEADTSDRGNQSLPWVLITLAIFMVYPALCTLYPAFEKSHNIRTLQYAHGVRPFPLWMSHLLFDLISVVLISIALTVSFQVFDGHALAPAHMFPISVLYGLAMVLISYLVSRWCHNQLTTLTAALGINVLMFAVTVVTFLIPRIYVDPEKLESATDAVAFVIGLFMPTMNLLKALAVALNTGKILCRDGGEITSPSSIYAYGGPIFLLLIQVIVLMLLLVWLESSHSFSALHRLLQRSVKRGPAPESEEEKVCSAMAGEVAKEAARVQVDDSEDLLRLSHVSKHFGHNIAVNNVSLGLGRNQILALLGPNGAGKTTLANMITGQLKPDAGQISLSGSEVHGAVSRHRSLGVCPQVDVLDLLTARQHVEFYARIRGVSKDNVTIVMERLGLAPHADKAASKLSGGNKRKVSLAVALVGSPEVLVLDEPSSAMDAAAKRAMWRMLADVVPGRSVLLTTHSMEEADALATRVAIMSKRLLALGTTQTLRKRYSDVYHVELVLRTAPESSAEEMRAVEGWVRAKFGNVVLSGESLGGQVKFFVPNSAQTTDGEGREDGATGQQQQQKRSRSNIGHLIETLESHKEELGLADYSIGAPTLERVFLSVMKENQVGEEDTEKKKRWWRWLRF